MSYRVDEGVLADPANEEIDPLCYYVNATAYLLKVLDSDDKLRRSPLFEQVLALVGFWDCDPSECDNTKADDAAIDAHLFGVVGKALYEDDEWESYRENQGNVFAYLVDEFSRIDRTKYHVSQCLITITRRVLRDGQQIAFPTGHMLIVHREAEAEALLDLSRHVYVVDSRPSL